RAPARSDLAPPDDDRRREGARQARGRPRRLGARGEAGQRIAYARGGVGRSRGGSLALELARAHEVEDGPGVRIRPPHLGVLAAVLDVVLEDGHGKGDLLDRGEEGGAEALVARALELAGEEEGHGGREAGEGPGPRLRAQEPGYRGVAAGGHLDGD